MSDHNHPIPCHTDIKLERVHAQSRSGKEALQGVLREQCPRAPMPLYLHFPCQVPMDQDHDAEPPRDWQDKGSWQYTDK